MEIVVLLKPVPEAETRLRPSRDGIRFDPDGVKFVLAGYDESALEQGLLLKEALPGSKVHALTLAPAPRGEEVLRAALALGADGATWVEAPADGTDDPIAVARALAFAIQRGPHDLVLAGKQSGDSEEGLVPSAVAEFLGIPSAGHVVNLRPASEPGAVSFERVTESGAESWRSPLPLLVALQQAWNDPRTAKLPNILKSRKTPIVRIAWADVPKSPEASAPAKFELPAPRSGAKLIEFHSPEEAAAKLVRLLRDEAKVFP